MKYLRILIPVITLTVLVLAAAAVPAAADPGDTAIGQFVYRCPFTEEPIEVGFLVEEVGANLKGRGYSTFAVSSRGLTFQVKPNLVRVNGDEVFFAGPIVNATVPGGNAVWWYFAAKEGSAKRHSGGAFGMYVVGASKWDFVEGGVVLNGDLEPDDFQPLTSGSVTVDGS